MYTNYLYKKYNLNVKPETKVIDIIKLLHNKK